MPAVHQFERRHQRLAPPRVFFRRLGKFGALALGVMAAWVALGMIAFRWTLADAGWVDAFHHASLLASGMGPVPELRESSDVGKIAESLYALVSGFVLLAAAGVVAAPIVHRVFHHFHVDDSAR
ncbi:MAG: hypothetical protein ABI585_12920 [Betaproteobacteria bacterium]